MITHATFEHVEDHGGTVRGHVASMAATYGVLDSAVLDELELAWRTRVNRLLSGTGLALIGERFVGPAVFSPAQARAQDVLEEEAQRHGRPWSDSTGVPGAAYWLCTLSPRQVARIAARRARGRPGPRIVDSSEIAGDT